MTNLEGMNSHWMGIKMNDLNAFSCSINRKANPSIFIKNLKTL